MIHQDEIISDTYSAKSEDSVELGFIQGFKVLGFQSVLGFRIKYYFSYVFSVKFLFRVQKSDISTHGRKLVKEGTIGYKSARGKVAGKMRIPLLFCTILTC